MTTLKYTFNMSGKDIDKAISLLAKRGKALDAQTPVAGSQRCGNLDRCGGRVDARRDLVGGSPPARAGAARTS